MEAWIIQIATNVPIPVITVLLIYYGRLIPRSTHLFVIQQMEHWREIALKNEKTTGDQSTTIRTQAETIKTFQEAAEFQKKVMEEVQHALKQKEIQ